MAPATTPTRTRPMPPRERGLRGARTRWGAPRRQYIADLTDEQRTAVAVLIEAFRASNAAQAKAARR